MRYFKRWGYLLILLLLVGGFFYQTIFFHKLPVPTDTLVGLYHPWRDSFAQAYPRGVPFKNFLITDPIRQQIPWKKIVIDAWKRWEFPRWNPYTFTGVPIDANIQAAPYSPFNLLFIIFDFSVAWTLLIMIQPLFSGTLMYLYLRRLDLIGVAALTGSIAWAFGGFATSWLTWGTIMHTALWLPLILLSIDELFRGRKIRSQYIWWLVCLGMSVTLTILGGHIQIAVYVLGLSALYGVWKHRLQNRKMILWVAVTLSFVAVITFAQWFPFLRFFFLAGRMEASESWKTAGWFLPWQHLAQFIAPDYFGNPATLNYWGDWNYGEFIGYIGLIPLLLGISALALRGTPRFFALAIAVSLFFMLPSPISRLPFLFHIPIISVLQPTRLMMVVDFSLAVLSAFGLDHLLKGEKRFMGKSIVVCGIWLMILWGVIWVGKAAGHDAAIVSNLLVSKRNMVIPTVFFVVFLIWLAVLVRIKSVKIKTVWVGVLVTIVICDLFRFGWKFTPFTPEEYFFPSTGVIGFLTSQPKPFRVMSLDDRILPPNTSAYYGIETIEGYDPIAPKKYEDFLVATARGKADIRRPTGFNRIYTVHNIDSPLLAYCNVRYVLSLSDVERPFLRQVYREGEVRVYEYTHMLPRVYLADKPIIEKTPEAILGKLIGDPNSRLGVYGGEVELLSLPVRAEEKASVTKYSDNELRLIVSAYNPRLLVILNRFDFGWHATVDGQGTKIFPVNYLFTGLKVPAGTHDVVLSYR